MPRLRDDYVVGAARPRTVAGRVPMQCWRSPSGYDRDRGRPMAVCLRRARALAGVSTRRLDRADFLLVNLVGDADSVADSNRSRNMEMTEP